jgi:hypothetical protein
LGQRTQTLRSSISTWSVLITLGILVTRILKSFEVPDALVAKS